MRIKFIGTGDISTSRVINAETGEDLIDVVRIEYVLEGRSDAPDFNQRKATLRVTVENVPVEIEADVEIERATP